MQPSRFNICLPDEPEPGQMLIFNTLSGSLFVLEPEYRRSLEALDQGRALDQEDRERLSELAGEGYVVEGTEQESQALTHRMRSTIYSPGDTFEAKVMTTSACNLACKYCFESHIDRAQTMDPDTARRVAERILQQALEFSVGKVKVHLYGGEPLLNMKAIEVLSEELSAGCLENSLEFSMTMTTNGTLLTAETARRLMDLGLTSARVSLDGAKELHDAQRPFRSGGGSCFEAVIANLEQVAEFLPIQVLTLCPPDRLDLFEQFLDELESRGLAAKLERLLPAIEMGYMDEKGGVCNPENCAVDERTARSQLELRGLQAKRGIAADTEILGGAGCGLTMERGIWVFTPSGEIHKCAVMSTQSRYAVGHLDSPSMFPLYYQAMNAELWQKCMKGTDCPYIPMCGSGTGCRLSALAEHGDFWGDACPRSYYEVFLPGAMRLELAAAEKE